MKDFSSVSPSALLLIRLKALTNIPFARETAMYMHEKKDILMPPAEEISKEELFRLLFHFENRYYTIEKLRKKVSTPNLMELSSGYSFRGLAICRNQPVHFIDTDLEGVIALKKEIATSLLANINEGLKGTMELSPLNVLDEDMFNALVNRFPKGPVTLLNEGLLVYLDDSEKRKLLTIIHAILQKRGGYWITADIYTKKGDDGTEKTSSTKFAEFRKAHRIDENKFDDFESAEKLFTECGFEIVYRESLALELVSCLDMISEKKEEIINRLKNTEPVRETWCLKVRQ